MVLAIAVNAVLAAIVFSGLMVLLMRAIHTSKGAAPAVTTAVAPAPRAARTGRSARALTPARPWA
jgi:hypothetical protein